MICVATLVSRKNTIVEICTNNVLGSRKLGQKYGADCSIEPSINEAYHARDPNQFTTIEISTVSFQHRLINTAMVVDFDTRLVRYDSIPRSFLHNQLLACWGRSPTTYTN